METTLKTRKKYNVDKKITIKYYLHEIKSKDINETKKCSLNILLTVDSRVTKFKSKIAYDGHRRLEDSVFNHLYTDAMEREKELITNIVEDLKPFERENFNIKEVYEIYSNPRWDLKTAISDLLFFELLNTDDSTRVPMRFYVNPYSFLQINTNEKIQERSKKYKSKIWFADMILWALAMNNDNGFLVYSPTVYDVVTGRFEKAILSDKFKMLNLEEKNGFVKEVIELLNTYSNNFFS